MSIPLQKETEQQIRLDPIDRRIVEATQGGLPLRIRPYHAIAGKLGLDPALVMERVAKMCASGVIRRIGAVPNHYALGVTANGMSVWDVEDVAVSDLGLAVGKLDFVSHCYLRPRHPQVWPYNLFAMVHDKTREEVEERVAEISALLGDACRGHDILYSTRILKKTGLRVSGSGE